MEKCCAQKHLTSFENNQNTRKFEYDLYHPHSIHWNPLSSPFHNTICPPPLTSQIMCYKLWQDFYWKIVHFQKISISPHPQKGLKFPGDGGRSLYNQKCKEMFEFPEWWWDLSKKSVLWGRIFSETTQFIMAAQVLI